MSYLEIYNEDINDLLAPDNRRLQIHESPEVKEEGGRESEREERRK